jgi:hypothetical protein
LKVVFLGSTRPTREMLRKVLSVCREKVYTMLFLLLTIHSIMMLNWMMLIFLLMTYLKKF